jgi:hypothetical protein
MMVDEDYLDFLPLAFFKSKKAVAEVGAKYSSG